MMKKTVPVGYSVGKRVKTCADYGLCLSSSLSVFFIILLLCDLAPLAYIASHSTQSNQQLGFVNTTVIIGSYSSFWCSKVSVQECLRRLDYSHINHVALVQKKYEIVRVTDLRLNRKQFYLEYSSSTTGLIDYLYLIKGSSINHSLCLASTTDVNLEGTLFIFDDVFKYRQYADNPSEGPDLSIFSKSLQFGANNRTVCNEIDFEVSKTSFYFIAARTPPHIIYSYDTLIHQLYLSKNDFNFSSCLASDPNVCDLPIPSSSAIFAPEEYDLVAYIEPSVAADPLTTHLCAQAHISKEVIALMGVLGGVAGISIVGIACIACVSFLHWRKRRIRREGYVAIPSIQQGS